MCINNQKNDQILFTIRTLQTFYDHIHLVMLTRPFYLPLSHRMAQQSQILHLVTSPIILLIMSTAAQRRLLKDLKRIQNEPGDEIIASPQNNNLLRWTATIEGIEETPWQGGLFQLKLEFSENYPNRPPMVKFVSEMFHPNIYNDGRICLDMLQNQWSPIYDVWSILTAIRTLLADPNTLSPANMVASNIFKDNKILYQHKVREIVEKSLDSAVDEDEMFREDPEEEAQQVPQNAVIPNQGNTSNFPNHLMTPMMMTSQDNWQNNNVFSTFNMQSRAQEFSFGTNPSLLQNQPIFQLPFPNQTTARQTNQAQAEGQQQQQQDEDGYSDDSSQLEGVEVALPDGFDYNELLSDGEEQEQDENLQYPGVNEDDSS